jgi:hypothetical protein
LRGREEKKKGHEKILKNKKKREGAITGTKKRGKIEKQR